MVVDGPESSGIGGNEVVPVHSKMGTAVRRGGQRVSSLKPGYGGSARWSYREGTRRRHPRSVPSGARCGEGGEALVLALEGREAVGGSYITPKKL